MGGQLGRWWVVGLLVALAAPSRGADTLVLPASECKAWFRLYRDTAMETELGSPLGGVVYPVLYLRIGSGWAVDQSTENLTLTITDNYGNYEAGTVVTKTYADIGVSQNVWQGKLESATTWSETTCPGHAVNQATEPVYFRYCFPAWNSMTEPLGNNGQHTLALTAPVAFLGPTQQVITNVGPEAKAVEVENLVISSITTNMGNRDVIGFDPDDAKWCPAKLDVEIADAAPGVYTWVAFFWPTGDRSASATVGYASGSKVGPGRFTIAWSGACQNPVGAERNVYTFDVFIQKTADVNGNTDRVQEYRSSYMAFADDSLAHPDDPAAADATILLYRLAGPAPPAAVELRTVDSGFAEVDRKLDCPTALGVQNEVALPAPAGAVGEGHAVLCALDDLAPRYRDHKGHRLWNINTRFRQHRWIEFVGPESSSDIKSARTSFTVSAIDNRNPAQPTQYSVQTGEKELESNRCKNANGAPGDGTAVWQLLRRKPPSKTDFCPYIVETSGHGVDRGAGVEVAHDMARCMALGAYPNKNVDGGLVFPDGSPCESDTGAIDEPVDNIWDGSQWANRRITPYVNFWMINSCRAGKPGGFMDAMKEHTDRLALAGYTMVIIDRMKPRHIGELYWMMQQRFMKLFYSYASRDVDCTVTAPDGSTRTARRLCTLGEARDAAVIGWKAWLDQNGGKSVWLVSPGHYTAKDEGDGPRESTLYYGFDTLRVTDPGWCMFDTATLRGDEYDPD